MPRADRQSPHGADVPRQTQLQVSTGQIPDFYHSVPSPSNKPLVAWLDRDAPYPTQVPRDDADKLPRCMICRLYCARSFMQGECLREGG
jgi:hypothetical protein